MADPEYQSIGAVSPDLESVPHPAWDGLAGSPARPTTPVEQLTTTDFSRWGARTNTQALAGAHVPPTAGYTGPAFGEPPVAAGTPAHFPSAPDGTIDGADAAAETSGNSGLQN